jgi:hypothetical protein
MDKDTREDVGKGRARKVVSIQVSRKLWGYRKKIVNIGKKSKRTKDELQHVLDSRRGTLKGSSKTMEKRKNRFEVVKGS